MGCVLSLVCHVRMYSLTSECGTGFPVYGVQWLGGLGLGGPVLHVYAASSFLLGGLQKRASGLIEC